MLAAELRVKKRRNTAFTQCREDERKRVAPRSDPHDQRIDHERHHDHARQQHAQDSCIAGQRRESRLREVSGHETEDAERREPDDDTHDMGHGIGDIREHPARRIGGMVQKDAQQHAPHEDTDEVAVDQRIHGAVDKLQHQPAEHFHDALRRRLVDAFQLQRKPGRKQHAHGHGKQRSRSGADEIHDDDRSHLRRVARFPVRYRGRDQHEHEHRRDRLERLDEEIAEDHRGACRVR